MTTDTTRAINRTDLLIIFAGKDGRMRAQFLSLLDNTLDLMQRVMKLRARTFRAYPINQAAEFMADAESFGIADLAVEKLTQAQKGCK